MQPRYGKDWYFNPRSREGSDALFSCFYTFLFISIHAPAKGATTGRWTADLQFDISIHAPAKGATQLGNTFGQAQVFQSTLPRRERPCNRLSGQAHANFNPRSREGSDLAYFPAAPDHPISIHAPAKGATSIWMQMIKTGLFQSTLPRRERHCWL